MSTTTTTVKTTTALLAAAAATAALSLAGAGPADAGGSAKCGAVRTTNGGSARNVIAIRISCKSAKAIAKKANGRTYKASGFTCRSFSGLYACSKPGSVKSVAFAYRKS